MRDYTRFKTKNKPAFYTGWKAVFVRAFFWVSYVKYILFRKRYPLFILRPSKGGLIKSIKIRNALKLNKIIKYGGHYYFSLSYPHYPSKAFDHMAARGGLNVAAAGTEYKQTLGNAILAITKKCNYNCLHCYEHFNLAEQDTIPIERWKEVVGDLQKIGVSNIVFSGGEPMLRYSDLLELIESGDKSLSDFHIHTSGDGVTPELAIELQKAGLNAAAVGLEDINPDRYEILRGRAGLHNDAVQALRCFNEAGIFTYVNLCLTKELIRSGDLWKYFDFVRDLNVSLIQLLEPRPIGGYLYKNMEDLFSEDDRKIVTDFCLEGNQNKKYRDYPLIYYIAYLESPERLGCLMGGLSHIYVDSSGNVNPCVFVPVSFGNIMSEDFIDIYKRMRQENPYPLHKQCPSLLLAETIRAKKNEGIEVPIPHEEIQKEWKKMFA